ncbi:MAG TPA: UDP-N-acetylmuramate:L-alanyl-gamma-D-glutamyl-meso-diaminopimelate ligase [Candidatus Acidoferrum sp.]|nr:UDP-N-acetylmuramate:L-alanyl-gamma-D-glutamyl-meso-diaminopimelate ligase [Candidatus Acidoferrum sp.]
MKHVHIIGIGGSAMSPLAGMLQERGYRVTGSDAGVYPPASTFLESLGIKYASSFDPAHLWPSPDLIVVGNAISRGNVEVEEMLDRKLVHHSLPEILEEEFLPGKHSIVVSGTHGKTTTTALLAWIFEVAGKHPNFLVGGIAENFGKSYQLGAGEDFILEGDEYDSAYWDKAAKFFHYQPDDLIITSLEFDHADIYGDFESYQLAFRRLVNLVPRRGSVVVWGDSEAGEALHQVTAKAFCPVVRYGFEKGNDWIASDVTSAGDGMTFSLSRNGERFGDFTLSATGLHNVLNAMAALIVADRRGIPASLLEKALKTFKSVRRRMDVQGEVDGILVVDDFAHHPTAIRATVEAARLRWPERNIWAVLEPRSNSMRRKTFQDTLPESLALADRVILGSVHRAGQLQEEMRLDPDTVATTVRALGRDANVLPSADAIADFLVSEAKSGDLVLIMSNGSFDGLCDKLLKKLSAKRTPTEAHVR